MAWLCEKYHTLPDPGGVNDQDYATMHTMETVSYVYRTITRLRRMYGKQIHDLTESERRLIRYLMDNQLWQM